MILIYLVFFLFSLGQLGRISFFEQQINIYLYELFVFITFLFLLFRYRIAPLKKALSKNKEIIIFLGVMLISFFLNLLNYSLVENSIALLYFFRLFLYFFSFFYLGWLVVKNSKTRKKLFRGLYLFIFFTLLFSLTQYFLYPDLRNLFYLGWDPHLYRSFALFFDTSVSSAIYGILILFFLVNFNKITLSKWIKLFVLGIYAVIGMLTYSRGFYLSIITTIILYLIFQKKYIYILVLSFLFVISLFILPKKFGEGVNLIRTFSIDSRVKDDTTALTIWKKSPFFGIGYNRIATEKAKIEELVSKNNTPSHALASFPSSFLIILVTGGIVGLISFIFVLLSLAKISELSKYLIIFTSIYSLFDNIFLHPFVLFLLLSLFILEGKMPNYQRSNSQ